MLTASVSSKIRTLFWIAASNFVIPVFLNVALLIDIFHGTSFELIGSYLEYSNVYVQIIGVVLATLWAAGSQWLEDSGPTAQFAAGPEELSISAGMTTTATASHNRTDDNKQG